MIIGEYGQKMTPITGTINKNIKKIMIASVTGPINKNAASIREMRTNGTWSKKTHIGKLGDVNGDGNVDILDYTMVRLYVEQGQPLTAGQFNRADVNRDGVVDATDQALIQQAIIGKY
ncbi:MAG: dockerin type I repeat-containing protein [Burkholderiales bacterium]